MSIRLSGIAVASGCAFLVSLGPAVANNPFASNQPSVIRAVDTYSAREAVEGRIVQAQEDEGGDTTQAPAGSNGDDSGMPAAPDDTK
jgi:hypothetical protein